MAFLSMWYETNLPEGVVDMLEKDLEVLDPYMYESILEGNQVDKKRRDSRNIWISTSHWIGGFAWHYIQKANRENFLYDITNIENESIQYTQYGVGQFYNWHSDADLEGYTHEHQQVRKLSFTIQLTDPNTYTGGDVQFLDNSGGSFFAPRTRGTVIIFDSRTKHRVRKVKSGTRKSLVGWVMGPRFK